MFESTPKLQATTSDVAGYAPYSIFSVIALASAVFFAIVLLSLTISAWLAGQPLFEPILLLLPLVTLVIAFAGRRHVNNSEGTRVGLPLCNAAWWIAVLGGVGYLMYLVGIGFAIRSDAEDAFKRWSTTVVNVNPTDIRSVDLAAAFHGTLPPDKQGTLSPNETNRLLTMHGTPLIAFRQSDLIRLAFRNKDETTFTVAGLEDWKNEANSLVCRLTVQVNCPEGEYHMSLPMQKQTLKGQSVPTWQIVPPQNEQSSFFQSSQMTKAPRLTEYGERIRDMEITANDLVRVWLLAVAHGGHQARVLEMFAAPAVNPQKIFEKLAGDSVRRMALCGSLAWHDPPPPDDYLALSKTFFKSPEKDPVRDEELRKQFIRCWKSGIFAQPAQIIAKNPDQAPILIPLGNAWEARVPIEIQAPGLERSAAAARGAVVLRVDDPAFISELATLKADKTLHDGKGRFAAQKAVPWRIVRIESDLVTIQPPRQPRGEE